MKMNLKNRILLGYLVPLALMIGAAVAVYWSTQTLQRVSESVELAHSIAKNVQDLNIATIQIERSTRAYLLLRNETSKQHAKEAEAKLREKLKTLGEQVKDPAQVEILRKISATAERTVEASKSYFDLVDAGDLKKAMAVFQTGKSIELDRQLDSLMEAFEKSEVAILAARIQQQGETMTQLMTVVLGATGLAVVLAVALGLWIASRISQTLNGAIAGMSTSSTEIAATVEQHERTVTQQAAAVNETTTTVEELGVSARQSASQAESAAAAAKQAFNLTQEGIASANRAAQSVVGMKQKISSVAEQILRLSEQAGQIGGIARVVGELASETNMLALNAAVEAARAGEQGKGFAVVAAEVRKLADQSKKSAERANVLVADIQKATNSAVMVTEEGARTADEVAVIAQKVVESFGSIAGAANSVSESAQQVMLNGKQQATALGQVTEAMQSLSAGSKQMAAGTEQTKIGVQKLNQVALGLKAMV